jgi:hypothetical protein
MSITFEHYLICRHAANALVRESGLRHDLHDTKGRPAHIVPDHLEVRQLPHLHRSSKQRTTSTQTRQQQGYATVRTASALIEMSVDRSSVLMSTTHWEMNAEASRLCERMPFTRSCRDFWNNPSLIFRVWY